jgi:hypothetical protein
MLYSVNRRSFQNGSGARDVDARSLLTTLLGASFSFALWRFFDWLKIHQSFHGHKTAVETYRTHLSIKSVNLLTDPQLSKVTQPVPHNRNPFGASVEVIGEQDVRGEHTLPFIGLLAHSNFNNGTAN